MKMTKIINPVSFKKVIFSPKNSDLTGLSYSIEEVSPILSSVIIGERNLVPSSDIIIPDGDARK